ncbi:hypothetical protein [Pseudoalteromonas sp.]|nr:hypothetical protein [Pseudoalteromonas sp.]MCP4588277.1 glycosyltransferase family 4 protein [Pseudoalteromonas sp.]|tara:strand:+ start:9917 stop:11227 length:1311 start_codon:yes stop_codon:yes gene_type:complete
MLNSPRTFFAIHLFETKPYEDSAGKLEVREPMVQSGLLGENETYAFGWQEADSEELVSQSVDNCLSKTGQAPVVVYGAGAHTTQYWKYISRLNVIAIADKNEKLWGKKLNDLPIISPQDIGSYSLNVLVSSRAYEDNIYTELSQRYPTAALFKLYGTEFIAAALGKWCEELESRILAFKPDLLVHTPTHVKENIPKSFFLNLKSHLPKLKIVTIWWDYDEENEESGYLDYERDVLEYADLVIENSNATRLEKMHQRLAPYCRHTDPERVIFHPTWFDPSIFYYDDKKPRPYAVSMFGSIVGERELWLNILKESFGSDFNHFGGVSGKHRKPISTQEYAELLRQTKVVINSQTYSFRSQCKGKVREALQCGAILLEQENDETQVFNDLYGPFNIHYYNSKEELINKIDSLLKSEQQAVRVGSKEACCKWTMKVLELL